MQVLSEQHDVLQPKMKGISSEDHLKRTLLTRDEKRKRMKKWLASNQELYAKS
jgi:hypothetical protein